MCFMRFTLSIFMPAEHQAVSLESLKYPVWPWRHLPGQAPSVWEFSVCPEPKHGLTSPLMPRSHRQTFAALLLYFPRKGPCVNVGQSRFSGTVRRVSHVKTTWHYKEFAEEVVLVNESRDSVGKAPFMSQSYAPVFFEFVSVQLSHRSFL